MQEIEIQIKGSLFFLLSDEAKQTALNVLNLFPSFNGQQHYLLYERVVKKHLLNK